ncbi:uncharacterized protein Z519_03943 [Cladophialophora bantiana CBS 173.52]|uniref:Altered inheritance of mitochondria protein 9, mitochondrial n=1 Tax=Cladophialophora bantiana (strain ATCC 10958 / CBS 173.52 / CDC B-1940 / NIH 8579) TaxID=1442370 RepID=A0A0D2IF04_CLAB1|nr:uncharacterized protein Z519_03943 [Cladophialophora bantiana CBS 173.52]KIW95359.1 hypothetical protein Z519_03943 [Cladophialophora bantiana CBS 173.52]
MHPGSASYTEYKSHLTPCLRFSAEAPSNVFLVKITSSHHVQVPSTAFTGEYFSNVPCQDELFQFTNGRFLIRDKQQRPSISRVREVEKLEGGFSKVLRIQRENGTEFIAKISCPNAGLAKYTTASEVAVLEYVREYTDIPVPSIYSWSADVSNPVGAEYIIMEKAPGVQLFKVWDQIEERNTLAIIEKLAKWESQLMSIKFPTYGCVYSRHSFPESDGKTDLSTDIDRSGSYCVGRSCDPTWSTVPCYLASGPWLSLPEFGTALAKREIYRVSQESESAHRKTVELMKILGSHSDLLCHSKPTLCHPDLHLGNIFVSEDDPSKISVIIDWQFAQIAPMFLQVRWPVFLIPSKDYTAGIVSPKFPDDCEDLDDDEMKLVEYDFKQATIAKAYEVRSLLDNKDAYDAMTLPRVYRELFIGCGETETEGPAPLRKCMIEILNSWHDVNLPGECPYAFSPEEIQKHAKQFEQFRERHRARAFAMEYLDTDADGWIPPEVDFAKKQQQNRALFALYVDRMSGQKSREEMRKLWPFSEEI